VAEAKAGVWDQAFDRVFRNTTVRRTTNRAVAVPISDSGMMSTVQSWPENDEITEE
jgi:hypothetical protein